MSDRALSWFIRVVIAACAVAGGLIVFGAVVNVFVSCGVIR